MAELRIKNRLESTELSTNAKLIQDKLNACLASDFAHITPGIPPGDHVKVIQQALNTIGQRMPQIGLKQINDPPGVYGTDTTNAVRTYKDFNHIVRSGQKLDAIVGRMTLTQIDDDLLKLGLPTWDNSPVVFAPVRMLIADVAKDIKKELAQDDDRDLVFLARLFEDDRIIDTGGGSELQNRLNTILGASSDGSNNGVTHFAGIYAGVKDLGFQKAFKDPFPGKSDNQVGHFTTAVDMGFRPSRTFSVLQQGVQQYVPFDFALPGLPTDESFCVRLIIGHEQAGDDTFGVLVRQAGSPTDLEIRQFFTALETVTASPNQDLSRSRASLFGIQIGSGQGNSIEDLHLSLFGFKFGKMIRQGTIKNRNDAALWIRTNIGKDHQDPVPPGPPTG